MGELNRYAVHTDGGRSHACFWAWFLGWVGARGGGGGGFKITLNLTGQLTTSAPLFFNYEGHRQRVNLIFTVYMANFSPSRIVTLFYSYQRKFIVNSRHHKKFCFVLKLPAKGFCCNWLHA
jgi:hypothetical protein